MKTDSDFVSQLLHKAQKYVSFVFYTFVNMINKSNKSRTITSDFKDILEIC